MQLNQLIDNICLLKYICKVFQNIAVTVVFCPYGIQAELQGGVLFWVLRWGEQMAELSVWVGLSYCDGGWNTVNVLKRGLLASAGLNDVYEQDRKGMGGPLTVSSPLYLGGVPPGVKHPALNKHSLLHGENLLVIYRFIILITSNSNLKKVGRTLWYIYLTWVRALLLIILIVHYNFCSKLFETL